MKPYSEGLRELADWLDQHPEQAEQLREIRALAFPSDTPEGVAEWARALGSAQKEYTGNDLFKLTRMFGPVELRAVVYRSAVCTRRVVGTREVVREVPDPAAPLIEVTETEEIVEWDCEPILGRAS